MFRTIGRSIITPLGVAVRILVAGASGLIGGSLTTFWEALGHEVHHLVREEPRRSREIRWDPAKGQLDASAVEGFDAAVCLSGAGIFSRRWTEARKRELRASRIEPTNLLAETLAKTTSKPECLICASATGFYGADRGAEVLTEDSEPGSDFVAQLCRDWEGAAAPAREAGIRLVSLRSGIVLSSKGGALPRIALPFRVGLGGRIGSGRQYFSWQTLDDVVNIIDFAIHTEALEGAVNSVAPDPVTNQEFTAAMARALHRPAIIPVPEFAVRLALGEMADLALGGVRVYPRKLETAGYRFRDPILAPALQAIFQG